jgi:alpha-L-fucosidase 2
MLVQSQAGVIDILPALPKSWPKGSVQGIRARGDVTVDVDWDACGARNVRLTAGHEGQLTVRSSLLDGGQTTIRARRGDSYPLARKDQACER